METGLKETERELQWGSWQIGGPRHYYREGLILRAITEVLPSGRVLDIGCGTGSMMSQLLIKGYEVYGTDMSEECVRHTTERLKRLAPDTEITIKKGNAEEIDYPDGFFDGVIAAEVLEHIEGDNWVVKEIRRLLKPGGVCLITVPANPKLWDVSDKMAGHKRRYHKRDLMNLFEKQFFQVEKLFYWGFPIMRLYHRLIYLKWIKYVGEKKGGRISPEDAPTRIGLSKWVTVILGNIFRIDNLFGSLPWGIGILFVARKRYSL